ncbi:MAG: cupin domain-containing protein [Christensenellaceae bacterium]
MEATFADITNFPISSCFEHAHKNWEIIYLLSGSATVLIGNHEYQIRADDILVLPPNTLHKEYSAEKYTDMYLQADGLDFGGIVLVHEFFPQSPP